MLNISKAMNELNINLQQLGQARHKRSMYNYYFAEQTLGLKKASFLGYVHYVDISKNQI